MGAISVLLRHPFDVFPLLEVKKMADEAKKLPKEENLAFCYDMLNKVSRSFAIVIQQLDEELRDAVCIFYLVLRALDTIEDDMAIDNAEKVPQLLKFHEDIYDPEYKHLTCGEKHYKTLMVEYPKVTNVFLRLKKPYKDVIADITRRMGKGMADFIESEVNTLKDWDVYCHYVAGLVGIGLSDLWAGSKLEEKKFKTEMEDFTKDEHRERLFGGHTGDSETENVLAASGVGKIRDELGRLAIQEESNERGALFERVDYERADARVRLVRVHEPSENAVYFSILRDSAGYGYSDISGVLR
jgi:hypothetical protein